MHDDLPDGFHEFWNGYLLGLAFTGRKEGPDDAPCDESIFDNPGGDIADVVDTDELAKSFSEEVRAELLQDAIAFFTEALPYIGDEYERAGSDFHLTRNGHGAGFWDGGWKHGEKLTELSKPYGSCELMLCADDTYYLTH